MQTSLLRASHLLFHARRGRMAGMRTAIAVAVFVVVVSIAVVAKWYVMMDANSMYTRSMKSPYGVPRFSVLALLIIMTVVAVILGAGIGWHNSF